jgi:predicted nucleic acid-binding protein
LELVPKLSSFCSIVLVPKAVREELFKRRATKDRLQALFDTYAFFQRCDGYEQGAVDFHLAGRTHRGPDDRGEVEAVVQASQLGAMVIIDDPWGRVLAENSELEFHGTLWVLTRFHELALLSSAELRDAFASLRRRGIRLPWQAVNDLLVRIGQQPL